MFHIIQHRHDRFIDSGTLGFENHIPFFQFTAALMRFLQTSRLFRFLLLCIIIDFLRLILRLTQDTFAFFIRFGLHLCYDLLTIHPDNGQYFFTAAHIPPTFLMLGFHPKPHQGLCPWNPRGALPLDPASL